MYQLQRKGLLPADQAVPGWHLFFDTSATIAIPIVTFGLASAYEWTKNAAMMERVDAEHKQQLAAQEAALARADRLASIGVLASGIGHEINNPLSYVLGNLVLLSTPEFSTTVTDDVHQQMLRDATVGAQQIGHVVKELMVFSRQDQTTDTSVFDVEQSLATTVALTRAKTSRMDVHTAVDSGLLVIGNEHRLVQVFVHLFINAQHACEHIENKGSLHIRGLLEHQMVRISITDNGTEIPSEHVARIFEPFFTTKPAGAGTGLGLAVTSNILRNMNGSSTVESRPGRTTFTVSIPAHTTEAPETAPS